MNFSAHSNPTLTIHYWNLQAPNIGVPKTSKNRGSDGYVYDVFSQENENYLVWMIILLFGVLSWGVGFLLKDVKYLIYTTT